MTGSDDIGLFWDDSDTRNNVDKRTSFDSMQSLTFQMPQSEWRAPAEFPNLADCRVLGLDLETKDTGLKKFGPGVRREGNFICGWALSDGQRAWYFPVRHQGGGNLDPEKVQDYMRELFQRFRGTLVGTNLSYDIDWAMSEGVRFPNVSRYVDVQFADPLLNENLRSYSLDALLTRRYGPQGGKEELLLRKAAAAYGFKHVKDNIWRLPARFVGPYAEADASLPIKVWREHLQSELERDRLLDLFDLECSLIPMLVGMRRNGVRIADDGVEELTDIFARRIADQKQKLNEAVGFEVNLNNRAGTLERAFDKLSIPCLKTAKGAPSFTKPWLANHVHWFPRAVAEGRKWEKMLGTFVEGHLGQAINGRIHCSFHPLKTDSHGTVSGRFSSSRPNLQQIPSRDPELKKMLRGVFVPEPGEMWWRFDWSQIEYRLLAHYAVGESGQKLRDQYWSDASTDFHGLCGKMAGIPNSKRTQVKNVNFGVVYGAGVATIASVMEKSFAEAEAFLREYHRKLPFAYETQKHVKAEADLHGEIRTMLNRKAMFELWEPNFNREEKPMPFKLAKRRWPLESLQRAKTYKALNRLLQGSAADMMKKAMADIWKSGVCDVLGMPLLTVHDELDFSASDIPLSREALREVKHIMQNCLALKVPVIADVESGWDWGSTKQTQL